MKRVERALAILLALILLVSVLAGCGKKQEPADKTGDIAGDVADTTDTGDVKTETPKPGETPSAMPGDAGEPVVETPPATPQESEEPAEPSEGSEIDPGSAGGVDADDVYGRVEGNTYTNPYFGFTVAIPEGWYIASREEFAQILQNTMDFLNSETGEGTIDLEAMQVIPMLFTSFYPLDYAGGTNPYISIMAQNISQYAAFIKDARSYLNIRVQGIKASGIDMTFEEVETVKISGKELARVKGIQTFAGIDVYQTMYVFLKDGFAVLFTLSSFTEEEARQLEDVMNSVNFR